MRFETVQMFEQTVGIDGIDIAGSPFHQCALIWKAFQKVM